MPIDGVISSEGASSGAWQATLSREQAEDSKSDGRRFGAVKYVLELKHPYRSLEIKCEGNTANTVLELAFIGSLPSNWLSQKVDWKIDKGDFTSSRGMVSRVNHADVLVIGDKHPRGVDLSEWILAMHNGQFLTLFSGTGNTTISLDGFSKAFRYACGWQYSNIKTQLTTLSHLDRYGTYNYIRSSNHWVTKRARSYFEKGISLYNSDRNGLVDLLKGAYLEEPDSASYASAVLEQRSELERALYWLKKAAEWNPAYHSALFEKNAKHTFGVVSPVATLQSANSYLTHLALIQSGPPSNEFLISLEAYISNLLENSPRREMKEIASQIVILGQNLCELAVDFKALSTNPTEELIPASCESTSDPGYFDSARPSLNAALPELSVYSNGEMSESSKEMFFILGLMLIVPGGVLLYGLSRKCDNCGKWWATGIHASDVLESWQEYEDIQRQDHTRDQNGKIVSTTSRMEQIVVSYKKMLYSHSCKHCDNNWQSTAVVKA